MNIIELLVREQTLKDDKDLLAAYLVGFKAGQEVQEWVDLMDDEVDEIIHEKVMDMRMTYKDLVRLVIAAFKEKQK